MTTKKLLLAFIFLLSFSVGSHVVFANGTVPPGGFCKTSDDCNDANGQSYGCFDGVCTVDGDAPVDGTVQPGGACTNDVSCEDLNGQSYGCLNGTCTLNGDAPSTGATTASNPSAATGASGTGTGNFVALTNLPVLQGLTTAPTLPAFFNALYKYCIGIAATLAVLQIIRAGIMYMGGDSVTETKQARALIGSSILGLVLVLSPVIVFGIINPNILNLNIGPDLSALAPTNTGTATATSGSGAAGTVAPGQPSGGCNSDSDCTDLNGQSYGCYKASGSGTGICTVDGDAPVDGTVQPGGACTNDNSCADVNGQSYGCANGICTLDGDANTVDGSVPPGGSCTSDSNCADANGQSYGCYPEGGGTCTPNGD